MRGAVTSWELVIADARGVATRQEEKLQRASEGMVVETSQELRMLSSVTINCQIIKIVMNSGSQLSEL